MATSSFNLRQPQSPTPASQEPSKDAPSNSTGQDNALYKGMQPGDATKLIELSNRIRDRWQPKLRAIRAKVLKNKEMLKGNHYTGVWPGTLNQFDAFDEYYNFAGSQNKDSEDRSMDRRPHNFYQMVEKAYRSALLSVPKVRFMPANADDESDRETAKAGSRVETIIERANKADTMVGQELMELFTGGCYFKFNRYVVDADRTGTHKETVWQLTRTDVLPARFVCYNCGATTPENEIVQNPQGLACPQCGQPLGQENYHEDHVDTIPIAQQKDDVANGMVIQTVYGAMNVDADPDAATIDDSPLVNVADDVTLGWARTIFPKLWDKLEAGMTSGASGETMDRQQRDMLSSPAGAGSGLRTTSNEKLTYNRTWFQVTAFAEMDDRPTCERLQELFPKGCMLAWIGEMPLFIKPAKLTKELTWCGTETKGYGLYPAPAGDPAVPIQERINDAYSKIDEYFDRLCAGFLLANEGMIDTQAMNNKVLRPGVLNGIALRAAHQMADIQHAIFQVKTEIDHAIFQYVESLKHDMELLVGTPPQLFGGNGDPNIQTATGQGQQLSTAKNKLGLMWKGLQTEHAEAAENGVACAAENMTEDWFQVVTDETKEARNEYVHLDQMKGSVHAEPEADQGFPMTYSEIKDWFENLITQKDSMLLDWFSAEPKNIDTFIRYMGVPGLIAPGAAMRSKSLRVIAQLVSSGPIDTGMPDPETGEPFLLPSVMPQKYLDDLDAWQKIIPAWAQEHWDKLEGNQPAVDNLVAFYKLCVQFAKEKMAEAQMVAPGGMPPGAMPPPQGQPQPQPAMA
ncbi:MAG TPA: hypothetical protein VGQ12_07660 [Candidatus Angelobacter sp.]|jgi:hypothetical protein|nr:hypothetical protein [Candidatus Angelobacter sp.]